MRLCQAGSKKEIRSSHPAPLGSRVPGGTGKSLVIKIGGKKGGKRRSCPGGEEIGHHLSSLGTIPCGVRHEISRTKTEERGGGEIEIERTNPTRRNETIEKSAEFRGPSGQIGAFTYKFELTMRPGNSGE